MSAEHLNNASTDEKIYPTWVTIAARWGIAFSQQLTKHRFFIFAFLATLLFYWPALQEYSINAGLLYSGDVLAYYLPALMKTHDFLAHHHFFAIDYSLFNGSSDFFLNANFFPVHPVLVLYSLLAPYKTATLHSTGRFLVLLLAFHSFLACYFSLKLFTRYFAFSFAMASFIAAGYAFSWNMIGSTTEPAFLLCATMVPWVIYGALRYSEQLSFAWLIYAALPAIMMLLGGYLPLGFACFTLSAVLVAAKLLFIDATPEHNLQQRVSSLIVASGPFWLGLFIVSPYLYAVYDFFGQTTSSSRPDIFYSAQQLAELPQTFIRFVSGHFVVPGPFTEFSIMWGVIAVVIFSVFFLSPAARKALSVREWKIFKVAALIYFATTLAIFGSHSVVSSFVYYFIPQIGKMHIYQRFLLPAQMLLMMMLALMLKAVVTVRPYRAAQGMLFLLILLAFAGAVLMTFRSKYALMFGINNYLLFEVMLGCLFAGMLLVPGKKFVFYGTLILFSLPAFNQMYTVQGIDTFNHERIRQAIPLDENLQAQLMNYLKRFNNKKMIKYADLTPIWSPTGIEVFPKDFPRIMLHKMNLSSYGGETFYLSALADYMHRMPMGGEAVSLQPDWQWLKSTGADFIIATKAQIASAPSLQNLANQYSANDLYHLPNDVVIIPLDNKAAALYDNGYFRIYPVYHTINLALNKTATQSGGNTASAQLAVDGKTNGDFTQGSVSHTPQDKNAWLDIDLGKAERMDSIKIWNRTDCCSERLHDYWVFVSDVPFLKTDTVAKLRVRTQTWGEMGYSATPVYTMNTPGVTGRYVRVQLSGDQPLEQSFLHLAEVEVLQADKQAATTLTHEKFHSNDANRMRLEFEANTPTQVQYLFWKNPRLKFYVNGKQVRPTNDNGLATLTVPAGKNIIEVRYVHGSLLLFWVFDAIFGLLLVGTLVCRFLRK